ncbi:Klhl6 [Symbiodinium pilosum]|uniref:Klhl6 protein n=1 Tax=Symbiodinium pilosum TaxID=2952 RepID=A0A812TQS3_SYMPI|nr:Klhl6 [Symbiodinium pilosum]
MASACDGDVIVGYIRMNNIQALRRFTPKNFDWNQGHGETRTLLLILAMLSAGADTYERRLRVIEWMLKAGADPQRRNSQTATPWQIWKTHDKENTMVTVSTAGRSPISFAFACVEAMRQAASVDWSARIKFFEGALELMATTKSRPDENIPVPRSVVDTWEAVREMTSTHNVVFEAADDEVSAHDLLLVAASPVLKAMLDSTMLEGSSKRISVKDTPSSGVRLFVDMLYSSSSRDDPDCEAALVALELAHRWQVLGLVSVIAGMLQEMLTESSFVAIAEAAVLRDLDWLQSSCVAFGEKNAKIQDMLKKGTLPVPVRKLLGAVQAPDATEAEEGPKGKRRRFHAP